MDESIEEIAGNLARQLEMHIAVAESCTGGLLSNMLTNVPGSSDYFLGSIVSYANQAKIHLLNVNPETLERFGAVSRETVIEMAHGVRRVFSADIGISVSGIAGPGGGTLEKPVGTTWIGMSEGESDQAWFFRLNGDRQENKQQAAELALRLLNDYLKQKASERGVLSSGS